MGKKLLIIGITIFIIFIGCQRKQGAVGPNQPPWIEIKLPPANDSTTSYFALLTITWNAGDNDGYPVLYKYRYTTYHLYLGDSIVQDWIETEESEAMVAFESSDTLNLQKFEVMAKDNRGDWSPTDTRLYYTKQVERPETEIQSPNDGDTLLFLSYATDTYHGVPLIFTGWDPDSGGKIIGFSYRVDGGEWSSWRMDTSIYVNPNLFGQPYEGFHTIEVKSKDNTNVEDDTPAQIQIFLLVPSFNSSILIIDETQDGSGAPESPTDEDVDAFYRYIFTGHTYDEWDYATSGCPDKTQIGEYRLVIWHSDDRNHNFPNHTNIIGDYLVVGGNLCLSGWGILHSFNSSVHVEYSSGDFAYDHLHIKSSELNSNNDFKGGIWGQGDTVVLDSSKLYAFHYIQGLPNIRVVEGRTGWTHPLVSFISSSSNPDFQGKPCGTRYEGTTYNAVLLDFPLYYVKEEGAIGLCDYILDYLGE